jgi:SAM-dependent methyltransferase
MSVEPGRRGVPEWTTHWDAKASIENPIEINGYCLDGVPVDPDTYRWAVVEPCLELLELEPSQHVLEVGCGTGLLLSEIEHRVERLVGTDISATMLARYNGGAETFRCAADELPFEGEQFDRILMNSVAHYFPDLEYFRRVVEKLVGLLRAPGVLVIGDLPVGAQPPQTPYRWYDRRELADVLEPLGLPFSVQAQVRAKRALNTRYDVVVYRD